MPTPGSALRLLGRIIDRLPPPATRLSVEDPSTTLQRLIDGASIGRYGDGEQAILFGHDIHFQRYEKTLAKRLRQVFRSAVDGFLVAVVPPVEELKTADPHKIARWRLYEKRFAYLRRRRQRFSSALVFRFRGTKKFTEANPAEITAQYLRISRIWQGREIVFVSHDPGVPDRPMFASAAKRQRVACPPTNAFSEYQRIHDQVLNASQPGNTLVLLSAGPMATVLAHDLFLRGRQAIDAGHLPFSLHHPANRAASP
ncbi:MAG: GT-D fold domain-containing protein [Gammaproteobacteria bacterium]|nr:GT-D fold domain-containing protein [Gammaproteobacteria bacterium]